MAVGGQTLESVIKPEMLDVYHSGLNDFHEGNPNVEADDNVHWFPRTCCSEHANFDKRTVGLFKLEWQGECLIGMCSKIYIISHSKVVKTPSTQIAAYQLLRHAKKLKSKLKDRQNRTHIETKF